MDYKQFVYGLGDLVLGYQILEGNLRAYFGKKAGTLGDFASEIPSSFGESIGKKYLKIVESQTYYVHRVAASFMDEEDFENSPAFEKACDELQDARKLLYEVNGEIMKAYLKKRDRQA